jgi:serine/threonine protein kinase
MHDARVYHRDLKDENIVMDQNLIVRWRLDGLDQS